MLLFLRVAVGFIELAVALHRACNNEIGLVGSHHVLIGEAALESPTPNLECREQLLVIASLFYVFPGGVQHFIELLHVETSLRLGDLVLELSEDASQLVEIVIACVELGLVGIMEPSHGVNCGRLRRPSVAQLDSGFEVAFCKGHGVADLSLEEVFVGGL